MRPDRSGYWWYSKRNGKAGIAEAVRTSDSEICICGQNIIFGITQFENFGSFKCWLGQALPPKKLKRVSFESHLVHDGGHHFDEMGDWKPSKYGEAVLYEDVKEYDLKT